MKCPYCGKLLTSSSYANHKNNTNCLYHRKGIYYCKCEQFATDKYHDFLNHARGCMTYQYDEAKVNRFDFSFEELYRIEKSKVELYEKIMSDLLGVNIRSMINMDLVLKKYRLDEYNEKFVTESEKSDNEIASNSGKKEQEDNEIKQEISYQDKLDKSMQSILDRRIFIEPVLLSIPNEDIELTVNICGYDDYIKLIFYFNCDMVDESIGYLNSKNITDLMEYQQEFDFKDPGSLSAAYSKYLFYLTNFTFLKKYLEGVYEKKSDHIDTFISNTDIDGIHKIFRKYYTIIFGNFEYKKEIRKHNNVLYKFFLNLICLDYTLLYYLFVAHRKISVDDIKFEFESNNIEFENDKSLILEDVIEFTRSI